ncbi:MAG: putative bifunctional diguanylate cyclase/phosphodiesterase [Mycobacterium sp.]
MGGVFGTFRAAHSVALSDAERSRAAFMTSSGEIVSTLQLALQNEESLAISASAFFLDHPEASQAEHARWMANVKAFDRYPELEGLSFLVMVEAADLPAYAAEHDADSAGTPDPDRTFQVIPPGDRPYYCFVEVSQTRATFALAPPADFDFCADPTSNGQIAAARDSGLGSYVPTAAEFGRGLVMQVPLYTTGEVPASIADRQATFVGMLGITLDPAVPLDRALQGHENMAVTLRYHDASSDAAFSNGSVADNARSITTDLANGWTVETFAVVRAGAVFGNTTAMMLLIAGIALSAVPAVLLFVLATSRARAIRLVTERTGQLRHQALHDALTGLPNRALIMDRIEQLLARNRRHHTNGALLFGDLDDFKNVNDTLGHEAGDRLLIAVATRLTSALRDADTLGRMGGDEFVVLIDGATLEVAPELVAERVLGVMRQPFILDGASMPLVVNTSVGVAIGDRATPGDLLRDADVALYHAKAAGKNCYEVFHAEMQSEILQRVELEFDLRAALDADQFRLVYQPIYNLEDLTLVGVEALLRWHHPTRGIIQPDEFIPILEQTGQIQDVGRWVLDAACRQMATWHHSGNTLDLSVNVSARQLDHDTIVNDIDQALRTSGLDPAKLIIEVTETALMRNTDNTASRLHAIKALGVRIAVDDFGTGYSSLAYLKQFPVDCLKVDRMFTNAITTSPESKALIGTLVQLGKDLGLRTLAEGVETTDQMDHLRDENVDEAQGFLFSNPLDAHTLEANLLQPTRTDPSNHSTKIEPPRIPGRSTAAVPGHQSSRDTGQIRRLTAR